MNSTIAYRRGRGSTSQILGMSDKRDLEEIRFAGRLSEKIVEVEIEQDEAVRELGQLIGYNLEVPSMEVKYLDI